MAVFVFSFEARGACRGAPPSLFPQSSLPWGGGVRLQGLIRRRECRVAHSRLVVSITPLQRRCPFLREGRRWEERGGLEPHRGQTAVRSWDAKTQRSGSERKKVRSRSFPFFWQLAAREWIFVEESGEDARGAGPGCAVRWKGEEGVLPSQWSRCRQPAETPEIVRVRSRCVTFFNFSPPGSSR